MLSELFELQIENAKSVDTTFKRYLYNQINWNARLIGIVGARGTGKTTLLFQYYKEHFSSPEECLYITADHVKVAALGLFDIASEFFKMGGKELIIDEVHKYPDWTREVKNIYDSFPKAKIVVSGSSTTAVIHGKHDLSRRIVLYTLRGLSFREYLELELHETLETYTLDKIVSGHVKIASHLARIPNILRLFNNYLSCGYYPFYLEGKNEYVSKLGNVIEKIISSDIPAIYGLKPSSIHFLRKLIHLVATSQPFTPNVERISGQLGLSKEYVYNYLDYLEEAHLFSFLHQDEQGLKLVRKAQKIYLENPNLFHAILGKTGLRSEIGAVRESFFVNQVTSIHKVYAGGQNDFRVDRNYDFEVGGKQKDATQLQGKKNSFIAADGIEIGTRNKIPLWLFGFLY
jgi:predicted AAA+ superfamily ATPase